jgi:ferredoxin--NADP+ reductase
MAYNEQHVTSIRKWSDKLFSFTTTRPDDFRFENGEFVTLGLRAEGKLIARAYSIVSTGDADNLEFLSIMVPDGPLTSRLVNVREGDGIWINTKATGSLTLGHLHPGRHLYMLATGTGLAPFMSLIRYPEVYRRYSKVVLVHTVRSQHELAYREEIEGLAGERLCYVPTVTREPFELTRRGSDLFRSGVLFARLGIPVADPEHDRIMLCGNPNMIREMTDHLQANNWTMANFKGPGNFTVEKAFVLHHDD